MGIEREQLKKRASRYMLKQLSDGRGLTYEEMRRKADFEFGLSEKWVNDFLEIYGAGFQEDDKGRFKWKP